VQGSAQAVSLCPLWEVRPPGLDLSTRFGSSRLPRGSLVQHVRGLGCQEAEVAVVVRSVQHWYRESGRHPEIGSRSCISQGVLYPVAGMQLAGIGLPPEGSVHPSALELGQYTTSRMGVPTCGERTVPMRPAMSPLSLESLAHTRAVDRSQVALLRQLGGRPEPYREVGVTPIQTFSDWGFVSMPVIHELSSAERAKLYADEGLRSKKQRERATVAIGARAEDGGTIYTRFLGSDKPRSDRWGTPHTVRTLVSLAERWYRHCSQSLEVPTARPETCTVQFGDIAWYNGTTPDPLGHTTHHEGTCVDIRLFRSDGSRYEAYWNRPDDRPGHSDGYDPQLTAAFLNFATETVAIDKLFFNDPSVIAQVPGLEARSGHDDHIHLCVVQP
jgi:hypothetical protein